MKTYVQFIGFFSMLLFQQLVVAATMIEIKQGDGAIEKIFIDGMKIRIDSPNEPGYVVIDGDKETMHVVSHENKQVIDMSNMINRNKSGKQSKLNVKFVSKGSGPKIAGYPTKHYTIMVNGKKCSDEFMSKEILKDMGVQKTIEKMSILFSGMGPPGMDMMSGMDACMRAETKIGAEYIKYGYPMRSLDANGTLESEVIKLSRNVEPPAGGFNFPKDYKVVNMGQMMQGILGMQPEAAQNLLPDMDPEKMKQMMEQMMKQMGQQ